MLRKANASTALTHFAGSVLFAKSWRFMLGAVESAESFNFDKT